MRSVTVETSVFADNGPVKPVFGKHVIDESIMTPPAKFKTLFFQRQRLRGIAAFMAQVARLVGKRRMCRIINHANTIGAMDTMAHGAAAVSHGIIHMLLQEDGFISLMAAFAERRDFIL